MARCARLRPGVWKLTITTEPRHRISRTITADRDRALRELTRLSAQHGHPPATMDALVTVYLEHLHNVGRNASTLRRYEQLWRSWLSLTLGATRPDDVRGGDVEAALASMARAGQSQRSIHQAAVVLNTTFGWAREQETRRHQRRERAASYPTAPPSPAPATGNASHKSATIIPTTRGGGEQRDE